MRILGIESTCDETAAAVVEDGARVLSSVVATQTALHEKFRGVVPEIASRAHLENISPVILEALSAADVKLAEIDAVAVAHRPGLIGSLLIGVTAAKTLAWAIGKPLIGVDHVHAHLYSVALEAAAAPKFPYPGTSGEGEGEGLGSNFGKEPSPQPSPGLPGEGVGGRMRSRRATPAMPAVGLVVSGGHTALYRLGSFTDVELLGTTLDDAAGEAYDKVASMLNLGYPGGPIIDRLAADGDSKSIRFPRPLLERTSLDFSFSGLKTSVLYHVRGPVGRDQMKLSEAEVKDVAAAFQAACIDVLLEKIRRAVERVGAKSVIIGGGVSCNRGLRARAGELRLPVFMPLPQYCTDNAAMTAGLAALLFAEGKVSSLDLDAITFSQFLLQNA